MADITQRFVTLNKGGIPHGPSGKDGVRSFWEQYRDVLETDNDTIGAFRTYYDAAAFLTADQRNR